MQCIVRLCTPVVILLSAVHTQDVCTPLLCARTSVFLTSNTTSTRDPPYACRGEKLSFSCEVVRGVTLQWASEPDICRDMPISYTSGDDEGETRRIGSYQSSLVSVSPDAQNSNFSSVLRFSPNETMDSVTVVCGNQLPFCSSTEAELTLRITGKCNVE